MTPPHVHARSPARPGRPEGYGVGLEWLVYLSFLVPVVLLAVIWYFGSRNTRSSPRWQRAPAAGGHRRPLGGQKKSARAGGPSAALSCGGERGA